MSASHADIAEAALFESDVDSDVDEDIISKQTVSSASISNLPRTVFPNEWCYATPADTATEMRSIAFTFHTNGEKMSQFFAMATGADGFDVSAILDQPPFNTKKKVRKDFFPTNDDYKKEILRRSYFLMKGDEKEWNKLSSFQVTIHRSCIYGFLSLLLVCF